jgi:hypothetical protein
MTHPKARFVFAVVLLVSLPAAAMAQRPGAAKEADFPKIAPDVPKTISSVLFSLHIHL